MNYDIRLRDRRSLLFGVAVLLAGVVGASLSSPWWLLMLPIGAASIFRFERNIPLTTLAEMKRQGLPVLVLGPRFYGVAHGRFCRGTVTMPQVAGFTEGSSAPVEIGPGSAPVTRRKPLTPWMSLAIDDIDRIEWNSAGKTIRFVLPDRSEEVDCPMTVERDEVLKLLRPARPWIVTTTSRKVFAIEPRSWICCLPVVLFSAAVVATSIGLLEPRQLPLADWNDVKAVRGKGKGLAVLWVLASQAYRHVVEQWPPLAAGIAGGVTAVAFAALLAALQWKTVSDETWTRPRPTGDGG